MSNVDEPYLRNILNEYFGLDDLRILCHDLGVDHELFSDGMQKISRIIEFITKLKREGRLDALVDFILKKRPNLDREKFFVENKEKSNDNLERSEKVANDINSQILEIKKIVSERSKLNFWAINYLQTTFDDWDKAITNFGYQIDSFSDEKDFYFLKSKMKDYSLSAKDKIAQAMSLGKALEAKSKWGKPTENDVSQLLNALSQLNEDITNCVKYLKRAMDIDCK